MARIALWNMDSHRARGRPEGHRHADAWAFLRQTVSADVALVQEAVPHEGIHSIHKPGGISQTRPWGSAVAILASGLSAEEVSTANGVWRGRELGEVPTTGFLPGAVAVARISFPSGAGLTAVSMYGAIEKGYASITVHRLLSDLEPLFDDPRFNDHIIVGGDLNVGTWWSGADSTYAARDGNVLARFEALGLFDCVEAFLPADRGRLEGCRCELGPDCRHVRTQRHPRWPDVPYQTDYVFASESLRGAISDARVWPNQDEIWPYSDHLPLIVDLLIDP